MDLGKVLVLNQDYSPMTVCSVNRAFLLVFLNKADILEEENNSRLRSITVSFAKPAVIRIKRYVNIPFKGVVLTRHNIFKRDNQKCQYCGDHKDLTLDHLIPRSKGGKTTWKNLVTACKHCNTKKGDMTPEQAGMRLSSLPFRPSYLMYLRTNFGNVRKEWMRYLGTPSAVA